MSLPPAPAPAFTTTYYANSLADALVPVRWEHPVGTTVEGPDGTTVRKADPTEGWVAGASGSQAVAESPGAFQGALRWRVPSGWADHFFLGLVGADADATNPDYPSHTLGLYLNLDAASGYSRSFDVYASGTVAYAGRQASPPVYWAPGARVELQVWRAAGGGFEGRFLLDERLIYTLPLPALAFPLTPHLSFYNAAGQVAGGFALRGPRLVRAGHAQLPPGPQAWWRADAGLRLNADGALAGWADQSGRGCDLVASTTYHAPRPGAWAGGQGVNFSGSEGFEPLDLGLPAAPAVLTAVLLLQAAPGADNCMPIHFGQGTDQDLWLRDNCFGLNTYQSDVLGISNAHARLDQPVVVVAEVHSGAPRQFRLWLNGAQQRLAQQLSHPVAPGLSGVVRPGGYPGYLWQGWLGEVALYDRALSAAEQLEVFEALRTRYPTLPAYVPAPPPLATLPDPAPPTAAEVPAAPLGWWRAASGLVCDANGNLLTWADLSGHGRTLYGGDVAPELSEWAGGRALRFGGPGSLDRLDLGQEPAVLSVALVLQAAPGASSIMPIHFGPDNNQDLWFDSDHFGLNTFQGDILGIAGAAAVLGRPVLVVAEVHAADPGSFRLWVNGVAQPIAQQQSNPRAVPLGPTVRLGGIAQWQWQGWIAEALLYDRPLTEAEQQQLATYARSRYAL